MSYADAVTEFISAMEGEGIRATEPIAQRLASGEIIRFQCEGDGRGRLNGWAVLYADQRPAGAFGNYRLGLSRKWRAGDDNCLTQGERDRLQAEWREAKERRARERAASAAEAAKDAAEMWADAGPVDPQHGYLVKKGLTPDGLRQLGHKLLVPMFDLRGNLRNLQRIAPDGQKRFLKGGTTDGLFAIVGTFSRPGETACIGEGYATMRSVHGATGYPGIVCFSAKNLLLVARLWSAARPDLNFIVCADDDPHLVDDPNIRRNLGLAAATAAAAEIGARVAKPLGHAA
jgi:putative DNA primase/helicase